MAKKRKRLRKRAIYFMILFAIMIIFLFYYFFLRISVVPLLTSELGEEIQLEACDFLKNCQSSDVKYKTDLSTIDITKVGTYDIEITFHDKTYQSTLEIKDTTAPKATLIESLSCYIGNPIQAKDCVEDIQDYSQVSVSFDKDYDFDKEKEYSVDIILCDEWDNKTVYSTVIEVKKDDQPPTINGNTTLYVKKGTKNVNYQKDLSITDNVSATEAIEISVDTSAVNLSKNGQYTATIYASDEVGNETQIKRNVVVYTLSVGSPIVGSYDQALDASIDKLLDEVTTQDMSDKEKLNAFYQWVIKNLKYKNNGEKAYKANISGNLPIYAKDILTKRTGHCFHYAALEVYVMNKLNIPVILVEGGGHNVHGQFELHYWTMVQLDGKWYHFDPLFEQLYKYTRKFFLVSSSQIYNSSHTWDKSKYPWS